MARYKLTLEYEGTRYSGWQIQKNSKTVQGKILEAVKTVFKDQKIELYGSGRTDAGVHALGQVAHLDVTTMLAPEIIRMKLNDLLPYDINILEVEKASAKFHARHDTVQRCYLYQISRRRTAFGKPFVWWIKDELNVERMKKAAALFSGMHDFQSFADIDDEEKSTKVLINSLSIETAGALILIRIAGSHFLWKMVRRIVGVLAEVGRGKLSEQDIHRYLEESSAEPARYTAPPSGLFLEKIIYANTGETVNNVPLLNISASQFRKR